MSRKKPQRQASQAAAAAAVEETPLKFGETFKLLGAMIWWRIRPSKYLDHYIIYKGKKRRIIAESFDCFQVEKFPRIVFKKENNPYKIIK